MQKFENLVGSLLGDEPEIEPGTRFRWKAQIPADPSAPLFLHALQWSLKAQ